MPTLGLQGMLHGRVDPARQNFRNFSISSGDFRQPNGADRTVVAQAGKVMEFAHQIPSRESFHSKSRSEIELSFEPNRFTSANSKCTLETSSDEFLASLLWGFPFKTRQNSHAKVFEQNLFLRSRKFCNLN